MEEEDLKILSSLQNLELETLLVSKTPITEAPDSNINPFEDTSFRRRSKSLSSINLSSSCCCANRKTVAVKHTTSFKRVNKKILRDPVLKFLKYPIEKEKYDKSNLNKTNNREKRLFGQCAKHRDKDFKSLLDACNGLNLGNHKNKPRYSAPSFQTVRSPSTPVPSTLLVIPVRTEPAPTTSQQQPISSCATQARMNTSSAPCDVTIDELASYFETSVHIPKKMSSMAEMMYI